jgi:hypothetical protein
MPDDEVVTNETFTKEDKLSILLAVGIAILFVVAAMYSYRSQSLFILAGSMGGLGGLLHEFVQSGGKFVIVQKKSDGIYLGTLAGALIGIIAGMLMTRGYLNVTDGKTINYLEVTYEAFTAGLALKGVVEAATGKPTTTTGGQANGGDGKKGGAKTGGAGGAGNAGGGGGGGNAPGGNQ